MANYNQAMFTGVDNIVDAWERLYDSPYYSVWCGKDALFQNNMEDTGEAKEKLVNNLKAFEQAGNKSLLTIYIHPKKEKGYITNKTPVINTMYVRCCPLDEIQAQSGGGYLTQQNMLAETLRGLNERLKYLEEETEAEPVEEIGNLNNAESWERLADKISAIVDKPIFQNAIAKIFNMPLFATKQNTTVLAGITPDNLQDQYEAAINLLEQKDTDFKTDMVRLALIARDKPEVFKMLLDSLRSM